MSERGSQRGSATKRRAVLALFASTVLIGLAYAGAFLPGGAPPWAARAMAIGITGSFVAVMVLGAARATSGVGRLAPAFAFLALLLAVGFGYSLAAGGGEAPEAPLWLGLPRRAATILYGIGILPLLVLPLAYARTFDSMTLTEEDIRRVREAGGRAHDAP